MRNTIYRTMGTHAVRLAFDGFPTAFRRAIEAASTARGIADESAPIVTLVPLGDDPDDCERIRRLSSAGTVLALIDPLDARGLRHAIAHGVACVDLQAEPDEVVAAAAAAAHGTLALPVALLRSIVEADPHTAPLIGPEERDWLIALSHGTTVVRLADDFGYSERAMFRRLADLYVRLGATNRDEAVIAAQRAGLLAAD